MPDEQGDLISQFLSDADASAEDKQALSWALNGPAVGDTQLMRLVLLLADWCYDEGYDDGEAGRQ